MGNIFTFQSGYIQINSGIFIAIASSNFTFQSGYIQIYSQLRSGSNLNLLYIPIWLYSNNGQSGAGRGNLNLYIPIWLYSNNPMKYYMMRKKFLYIPIWLYSNDNQLFQITGGPGTFTFQSGYIQIEFLTEWQAVLDTLHSNLVIFK